MRPSDLTSRTGISRATAHRLAAGLEAHGMLRRDDTGAYALGLSLVGLGQAAVDGHPLAVAARPALEDLRRDSGESAQLYVRDGDERLCVAAVDSTEELRTIVRVGSRLPLDRGSAGHVLTRPATVPGWVASVGERAPGVASVSAPVRRGGSVVAAVSVSGPIERLTRHPGAAHGSAVERAAAAIEEVIGAFAG